MKDARVSLHFSSSPQKNAPKSQKMREFHSKLREDRSNSREDRG
jgi:hypothetical protein